MTDDNDNDFVIKEIDFAAPAETAIPAEKSRRARPVSPSDRQFILEHINEDPAWIADQLGKTKKTIEKHLRKLLVKKELEEAREGSITALAVLHSKAYWKQLEKQYLDSELRSVEYHWCRLYDQFRSDTTHTEELQILKLIELEILISRCMTDKTNIIRELEEIEEEVEELQDSNSKKDQQRIDELKKLRLSYIATQQNNYQEYTKLLDNHNKLLKDLKATRDQRVKNIEDSKTTFFGWLKSLDDEEYRKKESRNMELFKIAMAREHDRLTNVHTYEDGTADQPLLTPEDTI